MSKGGSKTTSSTSNTSTQLPEWLTSAAQGAIGTAQDLSQRPYTPYTGQIVAQPGADTAAAYQGVRDLQGSATPAFQQAQGVYQGLLGQAAPITAGQLNQNTNQLFGNYQQQVMNPAQGLLGGYASQGPATAGQVAGNAQQLMNPYTQNVIDPALAAGEQARQIARQSVAGQANNVGAFGGSRQGVAEGVADAQNALGTQQQIGNMLTQGWNLASGQGLDLAKTAAAQGMTAGQFLATLGQQGYNNAGSQSANMAQLNQAQGMQAAGKIPELAAAQHGIDLKDASALQTIGIAQQGQSQQELDAQRGQFYEQQAWPVQNLDILLSAIGGVPYGTTSTGTSTSTQPTSKNVAGGVMGGAASGASIGAAFGPWGAGIGAGIGGLLGAL